VEAVLMKKVTTFKTTDGKEFSDEISAKKHENLITLKQEYKQARLRYVNELARAEKTIDGVSFAGKYHTYWYIQEFMGMPHLVDFSFTNDREFDIHDYTDELVILQPRTDGGRGYTESRISDLYYDRKAAEKALVLAQVEFLNRQAEKLGLSIVSLS
jgi:hypothetical protein